MQFIELNTLQRRQPYSLYCNTKVGWEFINKGIDFFIDSNNSFFFKFYNKEKTPSFGFEDGYKVVWGLRYRIE